MEEHFKAAAQPEKQGFYKKRLVEAALFLANREMNFAELALVAGTTVKRVAQLAEELAMDYGADKSAISVVIEGNAARMDVRPEYLRSVAGLSKKTDLTRKATKILALIAKEGSILQSRLRRYFRGEIYSYVGELKEKGYVSAEKRGATRLLKPTKKFHETFQLLGAAEAAEAGGASGTGAGEAGAREAGEARGSAGGSEARGSEAGSSTACSSTA